MSSLTKRVRIVHGYFWCLAPSVIHAQVWSHYHAKLLQKRFSLIRAGMMFMKWTFVFDLRRVSPFASSALTPGRFSCASVCVLDDEQPILTKSLELYEDDCLCACARKTFWSFWNFFFLQLWGLNVPHVFMWNRRERNETRCGSNSLERAADDAHALFVPESE